MSMPEGQGSSYPVEVSGWDVAGAFFVENTFLEWRSSDTRYAILKTAIASGSIVFVRLLQPISMSSNFPVAYQAVEFEKSSSPMCTHVRLAQLHPSVESHPSSVKTDFDEVPRAF